MSKTALSRALASSLCCFSCAPYHYPKTPSGFDFKALVCVVSMANELPRPWHFCAWVLLITAAAEAGKDGSDRQHLRRAKDKQAAKQILKKNTSKNQRAKLKVCVSNLFDYRRWFKNCNTKKPLKSAAKADRNKAAILARTMSMPQGSLRPWRRSSFLRHTHIYIHSSIWLIPFYCFNSDLT